MTYEDELKKKYPLGEKIRLKGYEFVISRRYSRNRYKLKLLERSKLDFTGEEFLFNGKKYTLTKRTGVREWMMRGR